MTQRTAPPRSRPDESCSSKPELGSLTFDQLDEAFQRGAIDATTLERLQCWDLRGSARSSAPCWTPRGMPARLAAGPGSARAALNIGARGASERARFQFDAPRHEARLVQMVVLVLVFVVSALVALSIAAEPPVQQKGRPVDEPSVA